MCAAAYILVLGHARRGDVLCPPSRTDRCSVICVKGDPALNGIVSVTPQEEAVIRAEAVPCNCCPGTSGGRSRQRAGARVRGFTPQTHKTHTRWAYCLITDGGHIDRQQSRCGLVWTLNIWTPHRCREWMLLRWCQVSHSAVQLL